jgi:two-component system, NtrC family, response regulator AtoC
MTVDLQCDQDVDTSAALVVGQSVAIQAVNKNIRELAATGIPVLIVGESGTGKEVYARLIHRLSHHSSTPLAKVNCRASESGEFLAQLKGLLKKNPEHKSMSGTQTVFLDGIDEVDSTGQRALLSVLPDGHEQADNRVEVRLIASASRNLETEIDGGRFRKELFFRISGVRISLPALRERKDDIPLLLLHFLTRNAEATGREVPEISQEEFGLIGTHDWPGNIRELEHFARKISLFGSAREAIAELQKTPKFAAEVRGELQGVSLKSVARTASRRAERELIREALERTHWNRKRAAEQLKISYKSLLYKIKQTGLEGR